MTNVFSPLLILLAMLCFEVCRFRESDALDEIGPVRLVEVTDDVKLDARFGGASLSSFAVRFSSRAVDR